MSDYVKISNAVIRRLPKYIRYLSQIEAKGIIRVSSRELSEITGFTASQIRQDLNHFGGFGQQGYGYNVKELKKALQEVIGLDGNYKAILIGYGNLGKAIYNYYDSQNLLDFKAIFDVKEKSLQDSDMEIKSVEELASFINNNDIDIDIVIVTIPLDATDEVVEILSGTKIKGVWNFTPTDLKLPENIIIEDMHMDESLAT